MDSTAPIKQRSLTTNVIMNMINHGSGVLFLLIVYPYISRILEPRGVGKVTFAQAVVAYFAMIATLGIPLYGTREAAKVRDDNQKLSQLAVELFLLNLVMTVFAFAAFAVFMAFSNKAGEDPLLFWICTLPMLLGPVGFEWLFSGLEEFKFVALRTLAFRLLTLIAVFVFVRSALDFRIYALIIGLNAAGTNLINLFYAKKHLGLGQIALPALRLFRHLRPILLVFSMGAIISIYTSLDKVMLGYLSNDVQVGYYAVGYKLVGVVVTLIAALQAVMLPRLSYHLENKQYGEYGRLANYSLRTVCLLSFPAALGLVVLARPLVTAFAGGAFEGAVLPARLMGLNIVLIAISNFIAFQVLYPQNKENLLVFSVFVGALINFALNCLLIPRWQATGAAASTLAAECSVTVAMIIISRPHGKFAWPVRQMSQYGAVSLLMAVVVYCALASIGNAFVQTIVCVPLGIAIYMGCMVLSRDEVTSQFLGKLHTIGTRWSSQGH